MDVIFPYLEWLTLISMATFILSLVLIPWYIARLPQNYFLRFQHDLAEQIPPPVNILLAVGRNVVGILLVAAGIIMLFLPGQGLLTILLGILCMTFPGKHSLLLYLISRPGIRKSLNWTRKKMSQPPFVWQK
ncbi:MAG: PGPGW domain-containing protein [Desulfopila sp.]|jgi:hypothetical protein|nr:PGPGW domain-containing protein [Desulfopila sp.]